MSESDIVKIFESIPQNEPYSRYNSTLEKIFKSQSLRHFVDIYKRKRAISLEKNEPKDFVNNVFGEDLIAKKMKEEEENNIFDETEEEKESEKSEIKTEENSQEYWRKIVELKKNKVTVKYQPILCRFGRFGVTEAEYFNRTNINY